MRNQSEHLDYPTTRLQDYLTTRLPDYRTKTTSDPAGIYHATGYTGYELIQLLNKHPEVDICFATSQSLCRANSSRHLPTSPPQPLIAGEDAPLEQADVVFCVYPMRRRRERPFSPKCWLQSD
ncbi:MAG: hypothetical protein M5U34_38910 [Chloroflexi bacterium]|nr:hypothetical protein [Chloroflexota bacterium]